MRIAFYNPGSKEALQHRMPPINLTSMAYEAKKQGAQPLIVNGDYTLVSHAIDAIRRFKPDVVAISTLSRGSCFEQEMEVAEALGKDVRLLVGGHDANHNTSNVMKELDPDYCVLGEGEIPVAELTRTVFKPKKMNPKLVSAKEDEFGSWIIKAKNRYNLNLLPLPNELPSIFSKFGEQVFTAGTINIARGCIGGCSFCAGANIKPVVYASPQFIVKQIIAWKKILPPNGLIYLVAPDFTAYPKMANEIIRLINSREELKGTNYSFVVRVDTMDLAMKQAMPEWEYLFSNNSVDIDTGLEALDPEQLKTTLTKTKNTDRYFAAFHRILQFGERTNSEIGNNLIIFTPETTLEQIHNNYAGLLSYSEQYPGMVITPGALAREIVLFPGTAIAEKLKRPGYSLSLGEKTFPLIAYKDQRVRALLDVLRINNDFFDLTPHLPLKVTLKRIVTLVQWLKDNFHSPEKPPRADQIDSYVDSMR